MKKEMSEIIEYRTAGASGPDRLDVEVNRLIELGYQPFGSPFMSDQPVEGRVDAFAMWQAMVKYQPKIWNEDTTKKLFQAGKT
jgi:hypothetical protein